VGDSWLQLSVRSNAANIDAIANFLMERGAPGVVFKKRGIDAYFPRSSDDTALKRDVRRYLADIARLSSRGTAPRLSWQVIVAQNWQNSWKRFIKPRRVGNAFWVTPPWLTPPKFRQRQVITVEPGMAFGTGTHATTRGCMEYIEEVAASFGARPFTALDVGTGSGILAIALVKLGARKVWAIDNDPLALEVARENLLLNGVLEEVQLSGEKLQSLKRQFPLVVANLTAETIAALGGFLARNVSPGGFLILSGILHSRRDLVRRAFATQFRVVKSRRRKEWVTLLLRRK
jgi:ribosomal protein L11 methyltransferase